MQQVIEILKMVFGVVYLLFLPGLVLSFVFFGRGTIDVIERVALSFALSIAAVPLLTFYLNLVGVKISTLSVIVEVFGLIVISTVVAWRLGRFKKGKHEAKNRH